MGDFLMGWTGLIIGFSGLIFIHELGHFILAKWNGVQVPVFSLGMGPFLFSFEWGGTTYALSMIPIGGYVRMMGQDDIRPDEPATTDKHDYRNKRPGQKAAILAAGAFFNLIFTLAAFTLAYTIGMDITPPEIGNIAPDSPLAKAYVIPEPGKKVPAKLHPGDRILEVGGVPVKQAIDAHLQIAGSPEGEPLILKVERNSQPAIHGQHEISWVYVEPIKDRKSGASSIGMEHYVQHVRVPLGFSTEDTVIVGLTDAKGKEKMKDYPAAKAGILPGDEVLEIRDAGNPESPFLVKDTFDILSAVRASNGRSLEFKLRRDGKEIIKNLIPVKDPDTDAYMVGLLSTLKKRVNEIDPECEAYKAGVRTGNYVIQFEPDNPSDRVWKAGQLTWIEKWNLDPQEKELKKTHLTVPEVDVSRMTRGVFVVEKIPSEHYVAGGIWDGLHEAWDDLIRYTGCVITVFKGLLSGRIGLGALSGPVGIGSVIHAVASSKPLLYYVWFMGFISLNLGVMQFGPIPPLDGWHLVLIAIEKLKGSPVSIKFVEYSQYVGIGLVGFLMLFATYKDILRTFFS